MEMEDDSEILKPSLMQPLEPNQYVSSFGQIVENQSEDNMLLDHNINSQLPSGTIVGYIPDHQKPKQELHKTQNLHTLEDELNPQYGKQLQKNLKKLRKQKKKLEILNEIEEENPTVRFNEAPDINELATRNPFNILNADEEETKSQILSQPQFNFSKPAFTFLAKPLDQPNDNLKPNGSTPTMSESSQKIPKSSLFDKLQTQSEAEIKTEIDDLFSNKKEKLVEEDDDDDVDIDIEEI